LRKILITGPEATGKTTLTRQLAEHFSVPWVPEYARTYLAERSPGYTAADLNAILLGQLRQELLHTTPAERLFCDTGPEVIYIWSQVKFGRVDPLIERALQQAHYDEVLLCQPDLPWEADPLREAPELAVRRELYRRYRTLLEQLGWNFHEVSGHGPQRLERALSWLKA
jgi:NadR type nicotinamide-nucleotide adenylyltransferase